MKPAQNQTKLPHPPLKPQAIFTGKQKRKTSPLIWLIIILSLLIAILSILIIITLAQIILSP